MRLRHRSCVGNMDGMVSMSGCRLGWLVSWPCILLLERMTPHMSWLASYRLVIFSSSCFA